MLQTKKLKMELQKAATTPVSQIANISGETNVRETAYSSDELKSFLTETQINVFILLKKTN